MSRTMEIISLLMVKSRNRTRTDVIMLRIQTVLKMVNSSAGISELISFLVIGGIKNSRIIQSDL